MSTAIQIDSRREVLSDQPTRACCICRLSRQGLLECGPKPPGAPGHIKQAAGTLRRWVAGRQATGAPWRDFTVFTATIHQAVCPPCLKSCRIGTLCSMCPALMEGFSTCPATYKTAIHCNSALTSLMSKADDPHVGNVSPDQGHIENHYRNVERPFNQPSEMR
jgi:hypothetical protein